MKTISKKYPVIDAQSAISDYNKKIDGFKQIQSRLRKRDNNGTPLDQTDEPTLDQHLMSQGMPATFSTKQALARSVGMNNYAGTSQHDKAVLMALGGKTERDNAKQKEQSEQQGKDKDYALKEKELAIKEKQATASKAPSADEIAQSLMKNLK